LCFAYLIRMRHSIGKLSGLLNVSLISKLDDRRTAVKIWKPKALASNPDSPRQSDELPHWICLKISQQKQVGKREKAAYPAIANQGAGIKLPGKLGGTAIINNPGCFAN
jgi:hypothetical protein